VNCLKCCLIIIHLISTDFLNCILSRRGVGAKALCSWFSRTRCLYAMPYSSIFFVASLLTCKCSFGDYLMDINVFRMGFKVWHPMETVFMGILSPLGA
jgi:hypothetical protein